VQPSGPKGSGCTPLPRGGSAPRAEGGGRRQVTHMELTGRWSSTQAAQALQLCMGGCLQLDTALRGSLRSAADVAAG